MRVMQTLTPRCFAIAMKVSLAHGDRVLQFRHACVKIQIEWIALASLAIWRSRAAARDHYRRCIVRKRVNDERERAEGGRDPLLAALPVPPFLLSPPHTPRISETEDDLRPWAAAE